MSSRRKAGVGRGRGSGRVSSDKAADPNKIDSPQRSTTIFDLPIHLVCLIMEHADINTFWSLTTTNKIMHGLRKTPDLIALRHGQAMKEIPIHRALLKERLNDAATKRRLEERGRDAFLSSYHTANTKCVAIEQEERQLRAEITIADAALSLVKSLEHMMTEHRAQKQEILDMTHKLQDAERLVRKMKIKGGLVKEGPAGQIIPYSRPSRERIRVTHDEFLKELG